MREQGCGTDLDRLLGGNLDLKLHHIFGVCPVIELEPAEFFRSLLRDPPPSPLLTKLRDLLPPARVPSAPLP
jgi:hypothetical protein